MMKRYALYYAPPPGPFADFASQWLGWDAAQGVAVAQPDIAGLPALLAEMTAAPRKYGFHGTIKAPFKLAEGQSAEALHAACTDLCARLAPVTLDGLALHNLDGFLALEPRGAVQALNRLAARVVTALDPFRAPMTPADLARRRPETLSPLQRAHLNRWGYPYVMEEFRFHLTLTGPLAPDTAAAVSAVLAPRLATLVPAPFPISDLCLFGEAADGFFHLLHRYPLSA